MTKNSLPKPEAIKSLVYTAVESYAEGFQGRHDGEKDDPLGTINMRNQSPILQRITIETEPLIKQ